MLSGRRPRSKCVAPASARADAGCACLITPNERSSLWCVLHTLVRLCQPESFPLSLYFGKCHPWNSYPLPNRFRIPKVAPLLLLATLGCGALVPNPLSCGVSRWSCLGLSVCRLVRLRGFQLVELTSLRYVGRREGGRNGSCDPRVSRKASPCWRVVLTRTAVSFLWRDGRVGLPA